MLKRIKKEKIYKIGLYTIILILIDLLSKIYFTSKLHLSKYFIYIDYIENKGSAFGIFSNFQFYNFFVIILSLIILILLFLNIDFFLKYKTYFISFIFLISGILGNLIDRIFFGYVRDFIVIENFFVFNLADLYLTIAFILIIYAEFKKSILKENL